jgi:hypothetical protein
LPLVPKKQKKGETEEEEEKIKEQQRLNAVKVTELGAASDEYPAAVVDVSTVNSNVGFYDHADLLFLQEPGPVGRKKPGPVEVQAGPFATFFGQKKLLLPKIHCSLVHCQIWFILSKGTFTRKRPGDADCNHRRQTTNALLS